MHSRRVLIGTWMYGETEGEESYYPAVGGKTSAPSFQAVYWRCVALFFATSVRHNPAAEHVLYTNVTPVPSVDGVDLGALLARWGVRVEAVPFTYVPPDGYYGAWRNQFYVFDLIAHLAATLGPEDVGIVLDSDCVWVRPVEEMAEAVREHGVLTYDVRLAEDEPQNGLTRRSMGALYRELGHPHDGVPPYLGGEVFAATGDGARRVAAELPGLWEAMRARFEAGQPKFNEEAHALSFVYHKLGVREDTAAPFLRRIWTTIFRAPPAPPSDFDLTVWHLPAEKRYGIRRLFGAVVDPGSALWTTPLGEPFRRFLGSKLGLPARTPAKWVRDLATAIPFKVRKTLVRS